MLASVLNTPIAVQASVQVVRAFVRLREMLVTNKALADKLAELERKVASHDEHIQSLFKAIRHLMAPAQHKPQRTIGFRVEEAGPAYLSACSAQAGRTRPLLRAPLPTPLAPFWGEGEAVIGPAGWGFRRGRGGKSQLGQQHTGDLRSKKN